LSCALPSSALHTCASLLQLFQFTWPRKLCPLVKHKHNRSRNSEISGFEESTFLASVNQGTQSVLFCAVNATEGGLGGASYEPTYVTVDGHRRFPQGTSGSSVLQQMDGMRLEFEGAAYRKIKSIHTPPVPLAWQVEEEVLGSRSKESSRKAGKGRAKVAAGDGKDVDIKCSNTCNGKPSSWGDWWPCWCVPPSVCTSTCLPLPGTLPKQPFWIVCFLTFWPLLRILIKQYNSSV
jgi:hypothetical protein